MLETNLKALEVIYPGQANAVRSASSTDFIDADPGELDRHIQRELERGWNPLTELFVIDRFAGSRLAPNLFDRIQLENLRAEKNRRLILLEDRLGLLRRQFEREDWRPLIESELCLFVIAPNGLEELKRLLQRYPDVAGALPAVFSGDPQKAENRAEILRGIFTPFFRAVQDRIAHMPETGGAVSGSRVPPYPNSIRFFMPGHNYLQEASVRALRQLGYGAERLQWKNPLHRFVRSTAWTIEWRQHPFDLAVFLNATPSTFGARSDLARFPLRKAAWFVDNPRRYGYGEEDFADCEAIGVFDRTYIPFLREWSSCNVVEIRTGFGLDPAWARAVDEFRNVDIAFVGELGTQSFLSLEAGFLRLDPSLADTVNRLLKEIDIRQPVHLAPRVEETFLKMGWPYRGALVEYLENKAAALRRRYFLDALAGRGLVIYGDSEWRDDPSAGPLRACYGGRRLAYGPELASLYASAKININIFHVQCVHAPNPRVYDVLACGGFLLTSDAPGLADEFEDGRDLVVFRSRDDLLEKTSYYLARPHERKTIAAQGQKRALASCGYHDRMQILLSAFTDSSGEGYVDLR